MANDTSREKRSVGWWAHKAVICENCSGTCNGCGWSLRAAYLDYVNNFLTVSAFAEHYGMTTAQAVELIESERAE